MSHLRTSIALLALGLFASCHDTHGTTGSESHFLATCLSDESCGPLFCITGMCTKPCTADRECGALAADGACVAQAGAPASAPEQICSVECERDAECDAFGDGLRCSRGRCSARAPAAVQPDPVTGVAGGGTQPPTRGGSGGAAAPSQPTLGLDPTTGAIVSMQPLGPVAGAGCDRASKFLGDEACLPPPAAGQGVQIHFGPSHYDDPAQTDAWLMQPGDEAVRCVTFPMPNDADLAFAEWELSARPGLHSSVHLLDVSSGKYQICASPVPQSGWQAIPDQVVAGGTRVQRVAAAAENAAIGRRIPAHTPASSWLHHFNFTDQPLLLELWLNVYVPRATPVAYDVPLYTRAVRLQPLPPGSELRETHSCAIQNAGRLLSLTTITATSARDLDAFLERANGERIPLLHRVPELDDTDRPTTFRFDSATSNPPIMPGASGGFSGQVAFAPGDSLQWSCLLANDGNDPLALPSADALCDLAGSATSGLGCSE